MDDNCCLCGVDLGLGSEICWQDCTDLGVAGINKIKCWPSCEEREYV